MKSILPTATANQHKSSTESLSDQEIVTAPGAAHPKPTPVLPDTVTVHVADPVESRVQPLSSEDVTKHFKSVEYLSNQSYQGDYPPATPELADQEPGQQVEPQTECAVQQIPKEQHSLESEGGGSSSSVYSTASSSTPCSSTSLDIDENPEAEDEAEAAMPETPCPNISRMELPSSGYLVSEHRVTIQRDSAGYGLRVCGTKPVSVHSIRKDGTADKAGLRPGDQIIKVNGELVEFLSHDDVVAHIRAKPTVCFVIRRQEVIRPQCPEMRSSRILTANEDPVLRSRSRRHFHKRRSNRDSDSKAAGIFESGKGRMSRPNVVTSAYEALQSLHLIGLARDSTSDSAGPYTDEECLAGDEDQIDVSIHGREWVP
ncbi:Rho guanine nucleotide exchange factor 12 [Fasciola hepatica]|uniref:Rho guanine nucleotide exchange factor 12 n=1 Tax=Fasciola hepatica TaxID=6192 RepID=A0A4E0RLL2_FASHE|nr:Rho guanine nucleotide exchange factor 12 [Fasciola hepatica]